VGDTVGDPFKDTSSVSLNPVIKFTTLFGLLAVEIAVTMQSVALKVGIGVVLTIIALIFVYRSFYSMRIPAGEDTPVLKKAKQVMIINKRLAGAGAPASPYFFFLGSRNVGANSQQRPSQSQARDFRPDLIFFVRSAGVPPIPFFL
jgi:hypothetical protein